MAITQRPIRYRTTGAITTLFIPHNGGHASCWIDTGNLQKFKDRRVSWRIVRPHGANHPAHYVAAFVTAGHAMGQTLLYLHHLIIGQPPEGYETDHENGNTLDCRRDNLRNVAIGINNLNRHHSGLGSREIRNVLHNGSSWIARVRNQHIGSFPDICDAVLAVYHRLLEIDPVSATNYLRSLPDSSIKAVA